jgi:hypothetical protein
MSMAGLLCLFHPYVFTQGHTNAPSCPRELRDLSEDAVVTTVCGTDQEDMG